MAPVLSWRGWRLANETYKLHIEKQNNVAEVESF